MRLKITHLNAPWPSGAVVGDVIELQTALPWAVGKCVPAPEGSEPTVAFAQPEPVRDLAAELEQALQERDELAQKLERANSELEWAGQHAKDMQAAIDDALAKSEDLAKQIAKRAAADALLPPVATGEGEGIGQPLPVIDDEPVKAKGKQK